MATPIERAKGTLELIRVGRQMENKANATPGRPGYDAAVATLDRASELLQEIYQAMSENDLEEIGVWYEENKVRISTGGGNA